MEIFCSADIASKRGSGRTHLSARFEAAKHRAIGGHLSLSGSCLNSTTSGFQAILKGSMMVANFEGQLEIRGLSYPPVLEGL
jgi:hypothetical protein